MQSIVGLDLSANHKWRCFSRHHLTTCWWVAAVNRGAINSMMAPIFNSSWGSLGFTTKGLNFELLPYLGRCFAYLQAAITAKLASRKFANQQPSATVWHEAKLFHVTTVKTDWPLGTRFIRFLLNTAWPIAQKDKVCGENIGDYLGASKSTNSISKAYTMTKTSKTSVVAMDR